MKLYGFMVKGIRNMLQKLATGNYKHVFVRMLYRHLNWHIGSYSAHVDLGRFTNKSNSAMPYSYMKVYVLRPEVECAK